MGYEVFNVSGGAQTLLVNVICPNGVCVDGFCPGGDIVLPDVVCSCPDTICSNPGVGCRSGCGGAAGGSCVGVSSIGSGI